MSSSHRPSESAATSLRDRLIERWFPEDTDPASVTDEEILDRLEDLVGEGWFTALREADRG